LAAIIIPGQSGTYRHLPGRVTGLLADSGLRADNAAENNDLAAISDYFRKVVTFAGLLIATATFVAVLLNINSKRLSWCQYREFYEKHPLLQRPLVKKSLQWGVSTPNTIGTMMLEAFLPLIFFGAWLRLLMHSSTGYIITIGTIAIALAVVGVVVRWIAKARRKRHHNPEVGQ
jgi:hypothetical protein